MSGRFAIRSAAPADAAALRTVNEQAAPGVPSIAERDLAALIEMSEHSFIAAKAEAGPPAPDPVYERPVRAAQVLGFLVALAPGLAYDSPNYRWFERRGGPFLYIDRIAVATTARGRGVGDALYGALIDAARAATPLVCEVNLAPPNPGSLRFHQRLGFIEIGRAAYQPGVKEVAFLERAAAPPG
ncbi:MAG: GNAT family N-acetyltransferase [Pseudomonadota bacterium]